MLLPSESVGSWEKKRKKTCNRSGLRFGCRAAIHLPAKKLSKQMWIKLWAGLVRGPCRAATYLYCNQPRLQKVKGHYHSTK